MKKTSLLLFLITFFASQVFAQDAKELLGAWESVSADGSTKQVAIMTDGYFSVGIFNPKENNFIGTFGGKWSANNGYLDITYEFNTMDKYTVGTDVSTGYNLKGNKLTVLEEGSTWTRLDKGKPGKLMGAWLITGRKQGDEMKTMKPGARKTMKILSGTRFQWIAYNTATREFMGTGGGTYTTKGGKYVENIDFFSRDNSRVGASLDFSFELKDGDWHHSGKSSKGNPIYEIWSVRGE